METRRGLQIERFDIYAAVGPQTRIEEDGSNLRHGMELHGEDAI